MRQLVLALCLAFGTVSAGAIELQGVNVAHDPGALIKDGDTYFNFTTGPGIWYSTSRDMLNWAAPVGQRVFAKTPDWVLRKKPDFDTSKSDFWAPDAIQMNGYYYIYYSISTMYTSHSAIGVARTPTLKDPSKWEDLGMVVESFGGKTELNAIDAAMFRDIDGKVYMSYGSFHGGIGVAEINQATGKLAGPVTKILGGNEMDFEAPYITRDGDWYYLFINRGSCCKKLESTYRVEVYRSKNIRGPYTERRDVLPMLEGKYRGPGHVGVLKQDGCHFVTTHYYDNFNGGREMFDILRMTYVDGWPVLTRNFTNFAGCGGISDGVYAFKSRLSGKALTVAGASTANGAMAQQASDTGAKAQSWYVIGHGAGSGKYSIINVNSLKSLDNYGGSVNAGTHIAQWDWWVTPGQRWSFASPAAGYVTVANERSGMVLDVANKSLAENAQIIQWTRTNGTNQQWSLQRR